MVVVYFGLPSSLYKQIKYIDLNLRGQEIAQRVLLLQMPVVESSRSGTEGNILNFNFCVVCHPDSIDYSAPPLIFPRQRRSKGHPFIWAYFVEGNRMSQLYPFPTVFTK